MNGQILKTKLKHQAKSLAWRAITTVILVMTAVITVWVYAAFVEPLVGPNSSDQDFAQNILGNNDANNDFSSSNVASNADGSIIERGEYLQTQIGTYSDATTTPSAASSVFAALKSLDAKYLGNTTATYTGNMGGFEGANAKCQIQYPGSHMCSLREIIQSGRTSSGYGYVRFDSLLVSAGVAIQFDNYYLTTTNTEMYNMNCWNWTSNSGSYNSIYLSDQFDLTQGNCAGGANIHCCK